MEEEQKNTELSPDEIVSSLKISEKLKLINPDDDLESEEDEEELDLTRDNTNISANIKPTEIGQFTIMWTLNLTRAKI